MTATSDDHEGRSLRRDRRRMATVQYVIMIVAAAFFLFPLVYMVASSFKEDSAVLSSGDSVSAFSPTPFVGLENYRDALKNPAVAQPNYARLDVERETVERDRTAVPEVEIAALEHGGGTY